MLSSSFATTDSLNNCGLFDRNISVHVLRLDSYCPVGFSSATGNKYFKLKENIAYAKRNGFQRILSFGGAYSNHIHALALAGSDFEIPTIGIIRGEESFRVNPTLQDAKVAGMHLEFVDRTEYRKRNDSGYLENLQARYPDAYIIPEGGSNNLAVEGCKEILDHARHSIGNSFDHIFVPCGTGATIAGIVASSRKNQNVYGVSVLKNAHYLNEEVVQFLAQESVIENTNWDILHDYHFGGYAKVTDQLKNFVEEFSSKSNIAIEPIYTGKMFYAIFDLIEKQVIPSGASILAIHTGGLQGLRGLHQRQVTTGTDTA